MILTAWKGGSSGNNGYGLKFSKEDRDKYINQNWKTLILKLEGYKDIEVNIDKKSFWNDTCREVISKEIGIWFKKNNIIPWEKGKPPKFEVELLNNNMFMVKKSA